VALVLSSGFFVDERDLASGPELPLSSVLTWLLELASPLLSILFCYTSSNAAADGFAAAGLVPLDTFWLSIGHSTTCVSLSLCVHAAWPTSGIQASWPPRATNILRRHYSNAVLIFYSSCLDHYLRMKMPLSIVHPSD